MLINLDGYFTENRLFLVGWCRPGLSAIHYLLGPNMLINLDGYFTENCLFLFGWCRPGLSAIHYLLGPNMFINLDGYFTENCLFLVGWCRPGLSAMHYLLGPMLITLDGYLLKIVAFLAGSVGRLGAASCCVCDLGRHFSLRPNMEMKLDSCFPENCRFPARL